MDYEEYDADIAHYNFNEDCSIQTPSLVDKGEGHQEMIEFFEKSKKLVQEYIEDHMLNDLA